MENNNNNADVSLGLHDFLERMRQPSASDFVKSIKSFIVSFSNNAPDPERDSALVQEFLSNMEAAFRAHPLWAGCSEEELDSAGEGLEKYVMTKLFTRVFASSPDDVKVDEQLAEKISLVQQFIRPENLDIKPAFQNESSWLLAQKELQKINMYKAPRDKLVCILSCCKVISNLLFNASIASDENPPGADEFLPVLIYVTIKANPPQLHSNLLYIQRYRRQSRLVAEAAYFLTNLLSAETFISSIGAKSLSMEESEFEKHMEFSRALLSTLSPDVDSLPNHNQNSRNIPGGKIIKTNEQPMSNKKGRDTSVQSKSFETRSYSESQLLDGDVSSIPKISSLSDIENRGATMLLKEDQANQVFREYPYLFAHIGDLTISDVEDLLNNYKQLVVRYVCLSKGLGSTSTSGSLPHNEAHVNNKAETLKDHLDAEAADPHNETQEHELDKHTALTDDSHVVSLAREEITEFNHPQDEVAVPLEVGKDDTS